MKKPANQQGRKNQPGNYKNFAEIFHHFISLFYHKIAMSTPVDKIKQTKNGLAPFLNIIFCVFI